MRSICWIPVLLLAASCSRAAPSPEPVPAQEPELEAVAVTRWTDRTELFAEYPPLAVGQTSRFAIHLTRLDSFTALTEGHVEVRLSGGDGPAEVFAVDGPSRPGIFGVDVTPARQGHRELAVVLRLPGLDDEHVLGDVPVYPDVAAARAAPAPDEPAVESISFLKEQQWALDFGTAVVQVAPVRESVRVPAVVVARPGGAADVVAPLDGRLVSVADVSPGTAVTAGQELGRVQPPPSAPSELPLIRQAQAEAATELALATRDRERAERLVTAGAAPQKRLDEARAAEAQAQNRVAGAEARLAQYQSARTAGAGAEDGLFVLRAPVSGVVAARIAASGANVVAGTVLFRIVDATAVQVAGQVPEADLPRARGAKAAEIEVAGLASRVPAGRFASLGRVLDPATRTVPITFALDNRSLGLALGQAVFLHLLLAETAALPVVPASALVDDAGRPIVFVQREGEAFERRPVTLGARSGNLVQVTSGVKAGDRVVTTGAYLVRLASLSTQVPSHGHVH
ncbi:MAG: efflux RND transporter periplasmic adaptor subunit [Vicinamibacterales bacterium]